MFAESTTAEVVTTDFSNFAVAMHSTTAQPTSNAFLKSLAQLDQSLTLDQNWADEYDTMGDLWHWSQDEYLSLLSNAPDTFAAGVVFGKFNAVQVLMSSQNRSMDILDAGYVAKQMSTSYLQCMNLLAVPSEWAQNYEDLPQQIGSADEIKDLIDGLHNLLDTAPNDFCKGVVFGKITVLSEMVTCMTSAMVLH